MNQDYLDAYPFLYHNHWWWRARELLVIDRMSRYLSPQRSAKILDVGCGEGLLFPKLQQFGTVEGVDPAISPEKAKSLNIHCYPFSEEVPLSGPFDAILMLDFLEHLEDPRSALRAAFRLLSDGGHLFVTVPAFEVLWTSHDDMNEHKRRYTRASLRDEVCSAGFKIIENRYFFYWVFFAKLCVRLKEQILGKRRSSIATVPCPLINKSLVRLSLFENWFFGQLHAKPPFGGSVLLVATKG